MRVALCHDLLRFSPCSQDLCACNMNKNDRVTCTDRVINLTTPVATLLVVGEMNQLKQVKHYAVKLAFDTDNLDGVQTPRFPLRSSC